MSEQRSHTTQEKTNPIARFAVERRVTMGMAVAGILVLGWISLHRQPLEYVRGWERSRSIEVYLVDEEESALSTGED